MASLTPAGEDLPTASTDKLLSTTKNYQELLGATKDPMGPAGNNWEPWNLLGPPGPTTLKRSPETISFSAKLGHLVVPVTTIQNSASKRLSEEEEEEIQWREMFGNANNCLFLFLPFSRGNRITTLYLAAKNV